MKKMKGKDIKKILVDILDSGDINDELDYSLNNYCGFGRVRFEVELTKSKVQK